jgi:hypothetical protein
MHPIDRIPRSRFLLNVRTGMVYYLLVRLRVGSPAMLA